ncbi:hypothetical protein EDB19DRAFT_1840005 [Suillus lakei]|nr:hypothetical protein EDB19DRAFT_1840005 [Suillus lakei]
MAPFELPECCVNKSSANFRTSCLIMEVNPSICPFNSWCPPYSLAECHCCADSRKPAWFRVMHCLMPHTAFWTSVRLTILIVPLLSPTWRGPPSRLDSQGPKDLQDINSTTSIFPTPLRGVRGATRTSRSLYNLTEALTSRYKKECGVNFTGKVHVKLNNAALVNHVSTDLDTFTTSMQLQGWTGPVQIAFCLSILLTEHWIHFGSMLEAFGVHRRHAICQVLLVWMALGANSRYDLNRTTESEATNLGGGERSLLSPAHTLVKDCKVVLLNEVTSVSLCRSREIQRTILNKMQVSDNPLHTYCELSFHSTGFWSLTLVSLQLSFGVEDPMLDITLIAGAYSSSNCLESENLRRTWEKSNILLERYRDE